MFNKKIISSSLILYLIILVALSIAPLNTKGELNRIYILGIRSDYFLHCLLFMPLMPAIWFGHLDSEKKNRLFLLFFVALLFAVIVELLQYFVPYRTCNVNDLVVNCVGVCVGALSFFIKRKNNNLHADFKLGAESFKIK